jgi:hypothetical protein
MSTKERRALGLAGACLYNMHGMYKHFTTLSVLWMLRSANGHIRVLALPLALVKGKMVVQGL